ncbi:hypothetical protein SADUNF_Sadunf02G0080000 [Salix dunnii]|uniref:Uncharacterized protein n=1 Tax=Salix dunnii TaxID=1413687 RepID=A0A835N6R3_9ROSI|nr:hypothetical protein SADUNF_Sadunf02G0080000 [Salix dunnii]
MESADESLLRDVYKMLIGELAFRIQVNPNGQSFSIHTYVVRAFWFLSSENSFLVPLFVFAGFFGGLFGRKMGDFLRFKARAHSRFSVPAKKKRGISQKNGGLFGTPTFLPNKPKKPVGVPVTLLSHLFFPLLYQPMT